MKTLPRPLFLVLWLQLHCMSRGEEVEQHPSFQTVQEGDSFAINCTYTDSASTYFSWYKQEPRKGLQLLMHILSNVEQKKEERLTVLLDKKDKHLSLHITATHSGDSATYFCASRKNEYDLFLLDDESTVVQSSLLLPIL
ncbi:T Cell Receptor Alpha Variable 5 [Manis pentadactyla]|nr:T Cell Receptor Alpha Variable 5 [Manis pentadactyla]